MAISFAARITPPLQIPHVRSHTAASSRSPRSLSPALYTSRSSGHVSVPLYSPHSVCVPTGTPTLLAGRRQPGDVHKVPSLTSLSGMSKMRRMPIRMDSTASTASTEASPYGRALSRDSYTERLDEELRVLCESIDQDKDGRISKWELFRAVQKSEEIARTLLPGRDPSIVMKCPDTFDEVDRLYHKISGGQERISYATFALYWQQAQAPKDNGPRDLQDVFNMIDAGHTGEISKLAMLHAVETSPLVARRLFPGWQLVVWGTWLAMRVLTCFACSVPLRAKALQDSVRIGLCRRMHRLAVGMDLF
ncbi:unnamed protein product [Symbiodinium sp. CCMP2592]|nr:unnamed protein product [Symbiodinium sp. CCMP2592]